MRSVIPDWRVPSSRPRFSREFLEASLFAILERLGGVAAYLLGNLAKLEGATRPSLAARSSVLSGRSVSVFPARSRSIPPFVILARMEVFLQRQRFTAQHPVEGPSISGECRKPGSCEIEGPSTRGLLAGEPAIRVAFSVHGLHGSRQIPAPQGGLLRPMASCIFGGSQKMPPPSRSINLPSTLSASGAVRWRSH